MFEPVFFWQQDKVCVRYRLRQKTSSIKQFQHLMYIFPYYIPTFLKENTCETIWTTCILPLNANTAAFTSSIVGILQSSKFW